MKVPGSKMAPPQVSAVQTREIHRNILKIFFFRIIWLRSLKFDMRHDGKVLYQVCSDEDPRVQDSTAPGSEVQTIEIRKK